MRRLGELRWRVIGGEVEVELQDQVNRSGRPRDERLPDVHTLVCLEFIRLSAQYIEVLEANGMPEGLTRGQKVIDGVRPERLAVSDLADDGVRGRVVSREALGDETIYVVETEAGLLNVRMPPTARFAEDQAVSVRHEGAAPPVYDPQTERLAGR